MYWILRGRSFTKKIIHKCMLCRRFERLPFKAPLPPPLPECRVKEAPAFSYTAVDFAGPLMIRTSQSSQSSKVWMALFTCYVTRAVHLDVVPNQSTPAFIRCLKRFVARRGLPRRFISDNGKTFKAASKYLDAIRAHFSLDELTTALAEIEAVLNSRPLSYVSGEDVEEPITPSHLIVGRQILNLPDNLDYVCDLNDDEFTLDTNRATNRVKHLNHVLNQLLETVADRVFKQLERSPCSHCEETLRRQQHSDLSWRDCDYQG